MNLCYKYDEFIDEKAVWIASLSDGSFVYQDDEREGEEIPVAWLRLKKWLQNRPEIWITDLHFRFRSNIIHPLPRKQEGYFFCRKVFQGFGSKKSLQSYVGGYVYDGVIHTNTITIPELEVVETGTRDLDAISDFFCIRRQNARLG